MRRGRALELARQALEDAICDLDAALALLERGDGGGARAKVLAARELLEAALLHIQSAM